MKVLAASTIGLLISTLLGIPADARTAQQNGGGGVTAIDILLEPDSTMLRRAQTINARLLAVYPEGFALDETHRPHITLIQRFVRTDDLDQVYAAVGRVVADTNVQGMALEAFAYGYTPGGDIGVASILVRPTPEFLRMQQEMITAVAPFTLETGAISAFTAAHDDPASDAALVDYVTTFVPNQTAEHAQPHVSTGAAPKPYLDAMATEPFEPFMFSSAGVAIYQLGPFGTAAKKLQAWEVGAP